MYVKNVKSISIILLLPEKPQKTKKRRKSKGESEKVIGEKDVLRWLNFVQMEGKSMDWNTILPAFEALFKTLIERLIRFRMGFATRWHFANFTSREKVIYCIICDGKSFADEIKKKKTSRD